MGISLCIYVAYVCMYVCITLHIVIQIPSTIFFEMWSLNGLGVTKHLDWLATKPQCLHFPRDMVAKYVLPCICPHTHSFHIYTICKYVFATGSVQCSRKPEEGIEPPGLELQTVVSHHQVLGIEPRTTGRATSALKC